MKARVLVVDDEQNYLLILRELLARDGHEVDPFNEPLQALRAAAHRSYDAALIDLRMGELDGVEVMRRLKRLDSDLGVVIMTAFASVETAVRSLKEGAFDYVMKPFDNDALLRTLRRVIAMTRLARENARLKEVVRVDDAERDLLGSSEAIEQVRRLAQQVARADATVLVSGETGTGKEVVARLIHRGSSRAGQPFVPVHCAALAESVLESELFGHEKGSFTGAVATKRGRFELAHGGTLFLDEVGEISEKVQIKLLRAIETRSFERVGGEVPIEADVRFIAATNRDLEAAIRERVFREDLYYRLNVVRIHLPPLRDRPEDIPILAQHVLHRYSARMHRADVRFSDRATDLLVGYRWPGNVRELENVVERALVISDGEVIGAESLPPEIRSPQDEPASLSKLSSRPLQEALDEVERVLLLRALEENGYVQARAAAQLGLSKSALHYKLAKFGIHVAKR